MEYTNRGTIMHLTLHNCTVQNNGTIMHLDGEGNHINNKGSIMHNDGGRVIIMGAGTYQQQPVKEKIVYQDRIVYRDRPTPSKKDAQRIKRLEEQVENLKEQIRKSTKARNAERLENTISFLENANRELKNNIEELKADLEAADRMKLLREIEELKEKVQRAKNRERISRHQQYEKGYQAGVVDGSNKKKEVFDWGVRPTKEQAEALMKQLRIWLDCED